MYMCLLCYITPFFQFPHGFAKSAVSNKFMFLNNSINRIFIEQIFCKNEISFNKNLDKKKFNLLKLLLIEMLLNRISTS